MENGFVRRSWHLGLLCLAVSSQTLWAAPKSFEEWVAPIAEKLVDIQKLNKDEQWGVRVARLKDFASGLQTELDAQDGWQNLAKVEAVLDEINRFYKMTGEDSYGYTITNGFEKNIFVLQETLNDWLSPDEFGSSSDSSSETSEDFESPADSASLTSVDASDDISDLVASLGGFEDAPAINLGEIVDLIQAVNGRIQLIRAEDFEDVSRVDAGEVYDALLALQSTFKNHATNLAVVELMHQTLVGYPYGSDLDSNIRNKIEIIKAYFDDQTEYLSRIVNTVAQPLELQRERPYQKYVQTQADAPLVPQHSVITSALANNRIEQYFDADDEFALPPLNVPEGFDEPVMDWAGTLPLAYDEKDQDVEAMPAAPAWTDDQSIEAGMGYLDINREFQAYRGLLPAPAATRRRREYPDPYAPQIERPPLGEAPPTSDIPLDPAARSAIAPDGRPAPLNLDSVRAAGLAVPDSNIQKDEDFLSATERDESGYGEGDGEGFF